jgi:23S rRNA pseudouridine1911/1915/1917 synthase
MIEMCFLETYSTLEAAIINGLGISKQQIKKYQIKKKKLNSPVKPHQTVSLPIDLVNHLKINPQYIGPEVEVLYEDENFLVLNKPFRVHMHPLRYSDKNNLLSFLRSCNSGRQLLQVNNNAYDRGLLYRLDYETSGIVYYAKKEVVYHYMREHFHEIMQEKSYLAIVSGNFHQQGEHCHFLKSSGPKGSKMNCFDNPMDEAFEAIMQVQLLAYNLEQDCSLLKVSLKSGHRHQIRSQLAHLGYPIVGDDLYGGIAERRLYLHAFQYYFSFELLSALKPVEKKIYDVKCLGAKLFNDFFDLNSCT